MSATLNQKPGTPRVSIIVVNYNCASLTLACVKSLSKLDYGNYEVIVVDNGSPDRSGEILKDALKQFAVKFIQSARNLGFAGGNNLAIRQAIDGGSELLWLLNPDTEVDNHALSALVANIISLPDPGAVGSKIYYAPAQIDTTTTDAVIWSAGGDVDLVNQKISMRGFGEVDRGAYAAISECDYLPGCSMLIPSAIIRKVGLLREEYFMYFEETDWCLRCRRRGYKLYCIPQSIVWHKFEDRKVSTPFMVYYYNRNAYLFWSRFSSVWGRLKLILRIVFIELPRAHQARHAATTGEQRAVFDAHITAAGDFLFRRFGHRLMNDASMPSPQLSDSHRALP